MATSTRPPTTAPHETFWRTLQTFNATRVVIALVLLAYLTVNSKGFWTVEQFLYQETCVAYLLSAIVFGIITASYRRRFLLQLILQVVVDITIISILYFAAGGAKSGLAILYLFPLAGAAILTSLVLALFFASAVTITLLVEGGYQLLNASDGVPTSQAGLYGAAFFAAVFVLNRLAARLIKQEKLATQRGQDLQTQQAINRLVIADMGDGILVTGLDGTVFTANPAAVHMLGLPMPDDKPAYKLTDIASLAPVAEALFAWQARSSERKAADADLPVFVVVKPADDGFLLGATTVWGGRRDLVVHMKLRFVTVKTDQLDEDRTLTFLQDVTEIEDQAQQLKLASMGRLTASLAHEVRNPLSAISYAAALMAEEPSNAAQSRLLNIVSGNVTRLNQMIEEILKLSRKVQPQSEPIALAPIIEEIRAEFQETHSLAPDMIHLGKMEQYRVRFDPLHLREVVVNLLSNAVRYASGRPGSIRLHVVLDAAGRLELHVRDDGPAITPEVRAHLFEPFYTTSSKGTGLGLYLARELCLNNGAMLDYEYRVDSLDKGFAVAKGRFVITVAVANL